jgi:hypothetical protein
MTYKIKTAAQQVAKEKNPLRVRNQKRANEVAWQLLKKGIVSNWSDALVWSWKIRNTKKALRDGVCQFTYKLVSGENKGKEKSTFGTLKAGIYPAFPEREETAEPKAKPTKPIYIITYFDVVAQGWRSFDIRELVGEVVSQKPTFHKIETPTNGEESKIIY